MWLQSALLISEAFVEEKEDKILEMAVYYVLKGRYQSKLSKDKKHCRGQVSFHMQEKMQIESQ